MTRKRKILLADDDVDDRMLFEAAYRDRQDIIILSSAINGAEVITRLENSFDDELPDLIILDQNMPKLTGKQTLTILKADERFAHIPVCVCSTYADHVLTVDCLRLGAYRVSSKPITHEEYQKMMNDFLGYFAMKKV